MWMFELWGDKDGFSSDVHAAFQGALPALFKAMEQNLILELCLFAALLLPPNDSIRVITRATVSPILDSHIHSSLRYLLHALHTLF